MTTDDIVDWLVDNDLSFAASLSVSVGAILYVYS